MSTTADVTAILNNPAEEAFCRAMLQGKITYQMAGYYFIQGMRASDILHKALEAKSQKQ